MRQILIYGDSLTWGIIPDTRRRLEFSARWPGVMEASLAQAGVGVRVIEDCLNGRRSAWEDPFKPGRNGLEGLGQRIEASSPLALVVVMLGTNDFQSVHRNAASHSAQGIGAIIRAIRLAPIEPGMPIPPILVVAPPALGVPSGQMSEKFAGGDERCVGMAAAYRAVAADLDCAFFDAGSVVTTSAVDGVHLDAAEHLVLGRKLAEVIGALLT